MPCPLAFYIWWNFEKETEILLQSTNNFHYPLTKWKESALHFVVTIGCNYEKEFSSTIKSASDI